MPASEPDIYIRGGLCAPKHVAAMGEAVWLYFHLHKRVRFDGEGAGETMDGHPYRHADAAAALGVSVATVKRWFARLEAAGYVTAKRLPYGLVVRITKYERASSRAARRQMRSVTSEPSPTSQERSVGSEPSRSVISEPEIAHFCTPEVSDVSARSIRNEPSLYKDARGTKETKETNGTKEGGAVAPAPHQAVVNAWLQAIGRDPTKAKDYGRYVAVGAEMAGRGDTPQDVGNCTRYLSTDPWRQEKGRAPSLTDVRDALPMWRDGGRPGRVRATNANGRPAQNSAVANALEVIGEELGRGSGAGGTANGGGRAADPAVGARPAGHQLHRQLPR